MTSDGTYNWNSAPSDPGEPSCGYSEPNDLLLDFEQWRIDTYSDYPSGLAHLLTDCFPPPGTVGLGYTSVTCHNSYGVGWSSFTAGTTWSTVAHEIGCAPRAALLVDTAATLTHRAARWLWRDAGTTLAGSTPWGRRAS